MLSCSPVPLLHEKKKERRGKVEGGKERAGRKGRFGNRSEGMGPGGIKSQGSGTTVVGDRCNAKLPGAKRL